MTKKKLTTSADPKERKRLTPKQWAAAEAIWESGELSQTELAAKFGISASGVQHHMQRRGIKHGAKSEEHKRRVAEEVTKAAIDDVTILAARIRETKEEHYKMSAAIAKMSFSELLEAKRSGSPFAVAMNNLKALDAAMGVLCKARIERYAVLGLDREKDDDDDGLPELLISELTADQIEELRSREFNEFAELGDGVDLDDDEDDDEAQAGQVVEE